MKFIFKNILLILSCYLYFLVRGFAKKKILDPKNIIVAQNAKLGDMVCTTPVFRAIKHKYPSASLTVIGDRINKEITAGNNDIDNYIVFNGGIIKTLLEIRKIKYDFGAVLIPDLVGLSLLYLGGVKSISVPEVVGGFCPWETKTYKLLKRLVNKEFHKIGNYAPKEYLKLLEPINIFTSDTKKYLSFSDKASKKIDVFFTQNNIDISTDFIIGISPSSGNKIKNWGSEKFAKLADYIFEKYKAKIIIIGGKNDADEVGDMIGCMNKKTEYFDALNLFDIDELKALISKMNLFISVDTGPIYIAEAFNVPTIDIVGPIDEVEQPPISKFNRVVKIDRERSALYVMNSKFYDKKEAMRQTNEITVEMVVEELHVIMGLIHKKHVIV